MKDFKIELIITMCFDFYFINNLKCKLSNIYLKYY